MLQFGFADKYGFMELDDVSVMPIEIAPPAFLTQPANQFVFAGESAVLSATVVGGLPMSYQWSFNGTNLADDGNISGSATNALTIASVNATNAGNYALVASSSYGSATSSIAVLTVLPAASPQYFTDNGGPLSWDTTTTDWGNVSGGPYTNLWSAGSDAIFEGTGGTVNVSTVTAEHLVFNAPGYFLTNGTITLSGTPLVGIANNGTINSALAGSGIGIATVGNGTLTLSGVNTYTGPTTIGAIGAGSLVLGGAGSLGSGSYSAVITNNGTLVHNSSASQTLSGVISGPGTVTQQSGGDLTLAAANTYSGGTTLAGATTRLKNNSALGNGPVTVSANATLAAASGSAALSITNTVNISSSTLSVDSGYANLTLNGNIIGSAGNFATVSSGTTVIAGATSYTGSTTVGADNKGAILTYTGGGSSSGGTSLLVGSTSGKGTVNMNSTGTIAFLSYPLRVGGLGGATDKGVGAINQTAGTANYGSASSSVYTFLGDQLNTTLGGMFTGATNAYGYYNLSGGTMNVLYRIRIGAGGVGVYYQSGGNMTDAGYLAIASQDSSATSGGGNGMATFVGGTASVNGNYIILGDKPRSVGILNIGTEAGGTGSLTNSTITSPAVSLLNDAAATNAFLNPEQRHVGGEQHHSARFRQHERGRNRAGELQRRHDSGRHHQHFCFVHYEFRNAHQVLQGRFDD